MYTKIKPRAFTLIELLVVISIIALLVGILLPALGAARSTAIRIKCLAGIRDIGQAMQAYVTDNDDNLPSSGDIWGNPGSGKAYHRWTSKVAPYYGNEDFQSSQDIYNFLHFKCPTQLDDFSTTGSSAAVSALGVYGYNPFFRGMGRPPGTPQWTYRRIGIVRRTSKLPLLADMSGYGPGGTTASFGGGLHMNYAGPHFSAENYGWTGVTVGDGPAPNHKGSTNYLYADMHAEAESENWPWRDFIGTDFHPTGDLNDRTITNIP